MFLQAVFWFGACSYIGFMVVTLIDFGWSQSEAAGAITIMSVIIFLIQPMYGYLCDRYFSEKKMSVCLIGLSVVFMVLLPLALYSGNRVLILLNMVGMTISCMQVSGLVDSWIVGLSQEFAGINYGFIRGSGSLGFALAAQVTGIITGYFGHQSRLWLGSIFIFLSLLLAIRFRSTKRVRVLSGQKKETTRLSGIEALKLIFHSKQYCLLLAVVFFLFLSQASLNILIQILILDLGGTTIQIGTAIAITAGSEIPIMFLMAILLKKFGYKKLFIFSGIFFVIRMLAMAFAVRIFVVYGIQLLQAFGFAVLLPIAISFLAKIVDERVRSTAITTFAAITGSLPGILANLMTTALLANEISIQAIMLMFAAAAVIGLALVIYGAVRKVWDVSFP